MGVSQPARFGEDWSDERVKSYLNHEPPAGHDADFHVLITAYKHMRGYDFERFLGFFQAAGRNVSAVGPEGKTMMELAKAHPKSAEFVAILDAVGAK
ncbi:MAG: PA4642 family protein [Moraxellaceae bacterium]